VLRPLAVSVLLLLAAGSVRAAVRTVSIACVLLVLPTQAWTAATEQALALDRPLVAVRDCLHELQQLRPDLRRGLYLSDPVDPELAVHPLFYNFRNSGVWTTGMDRYDEELAARIDGTGTQTPMLLSTVQWREERATRWPDSADADITAAPDAVQVTPGVVLVLPGPYETCLPAALAAGGRTPGATPP
jgi:hypothetical protein